MISPQLQAAAARTFVMVMGIIVAGLVPLYPQIIGNAPLDKEAMIRAFAGGLVGAVIARFGGEGIYDSIRASKVNSGNMAGLSDADVGATHVQTYLNEQQQPVGNVWSSWSAPGPIPYANLRPVEPPLPQGPEPRPPAVPDPLNAEDTVEH